MPMTLRGKPHIKFFDVRLSSIIMVGLSLLLFCSFGTALRAQTIEIKLVNGRNGRPIASTCIYLWVGDRSKPSSGPLLQTETDKNGSAILRLTHEHAELNNQSQRLACGLQGIVNPVVEYGDTISVRPGYALCQPHRPDYSWLARTDFSTEEVLQRGIVTANTCGKATASPKPGSVILFVRPLSWWEKLKQ
jgi:hypothetical protein